jgi:hypothetical protein
MVGAARSCGQALTLLFPNDDNDLDSGSAMRAREEETEGIPELN